LLLTAVRTAILQNMYPELARGVEQHSTFASEPLERLFRSAPQIAGVIYDETAETTGTTVRDYHKNIRGVDGAGLSYHALHPWTYYWAHATFLDMMYCTSDYFAEPLTEEQKEQLFAEHITWWQRYGMTMRPVPQNWEEFKRYWDCTLMEKLQDTAAARSVLAVLDDLPKPPFASWLPERLWRNVRPPIAYFYHWVTIGTLPPPARDAMRIVWSERDERTLRFIGKLVRRTWRVVPHRFRYTKRARAGFRRERQASRSRRGSTPLAAP
jgi:uncharacterized protein (DUF2236 family)